MRRLTTLFAIVTTGVALMAAPALAAPAPPPPPVGQLPNGLLLGVAPYQGTGTEAPDGSITASGTYFNFPILGAGSYQYSLGPPEPKPVPGGFLREGEFALSFPDGGLEGRLLCNDALSSCLWSVSGGPDPFLQFFSNGHRKLIGRGGFFTESGFFHNYTALPTEQR
jgi:hypothetical protein